jgi:hypothetical protein
MLKRLPELRPPPKTARELIDLVVVVAEHYADDVTVLDDALRSLWFLAHRLDPAIDASPWLAWGLRVAGSSRRTIDGDS